MALFTEVLSALLRGDAIKVASTDAKIPSVVEGVDIYRC